MDENFQLFLNSMDTNIQELVTSLHHLLLEHGYLCEVKKAKSGYLVSYLSKASKRTIASFVTRKSGLKLRMYPDHIGTYQAILDTFPSNMKKEIQKSSLCKRLVNPDDCNPKCKQGFTFTMDDVLYQKCRYMAFMPTVTEKSYPFIKALLENELAIV